METCKHCATKLPKEETIFTDYFQVHGEGAPVYTLCGPCYLKDIDKYLKEEKPLCACGAPEVKFFDDAETISMGADEAILNLICSKTKKRLDEGEITLEELEDIGEDGIEHTVNYMFYIRWFSDEKVGWV